MLLAVSLIVHDDFSHISDCLTSLFASEDELDFDVFVTVNRGSKSEIDHLRKQFPVVHLIINHEPRGFAANHNHVLAATDTPYIALLNDDILIEPGALSLMAHFLKENPRVGLVGPYLQTPDGHPEAAAYSDPSLLRMIYRISGLAALTQQGSFLRGLFLRLGGRRLVPVDSFDLSRETRRVEIVVGTAMLVRREAYKDVGPMDETTLAYGEDVDWSYRFRQHGWEVAVVGEAAVTHFGSGQIQSQLRGPIFVESQKGILNFFIKHRPGWQTAVIRLSMMSAFGLRGIVSLFFAPGWACILLQTAWMAATWRRDER